MLEGQMPGDSLSTLPILPNPHTKLLLLSWAKGPHKPSSHVGLFLLGAPEAA